MPAVEEEVDEKVALHNKPESESQNSEKGSDEAEQEEVEESKPIANAPVLGNDVENEEEAEGNA